MGRREIGSERRRERLPCCSSSLALAGPSGGAQWRGAVFSCRTPPAGALVDQGASGGQAVQAEDLREASRAAGLRGPSGFATGTATGTVVWYRDCGVAARPSRNTQGEGGALAMGESGNTHRPKGGVLVPGHRHVLGGSTQGKGTGIVNAAGPHKGQRGGGHHGVLTTVSLVAVGKTALLPR